MGEKIVFSTRIDEQLIKQLKHLAVDTGKKVFELLEEAIRDLIIKYQTNAKK